MSLNEKTLKSSFKQSLKKLGDAAPDVEAAVSDEINAFIARTDFSALQAAEINLVLQQQLGVIFDAFNLGFDAKGRDFVGGDVADVLAAEIQSAQAFLDASTPIHEQAQVFVSDFVQKTFGGADDIGAQVEAELNSFIGNTDFSDMDLSAVSHALNDEISSIYAELGVDIETVSAERNEAFSASAHLEKLLGGSAITGAYDELLSGAEGYARALEEWGKQTGIHAAAPDPSGDYEGAGDPSFMQRQNIMFSALHNQGKLGKGDKMTADLGFIKDADNLGEQIRFDTSIIKSILSDTSKTATDIVHAFNDTGLMISEELFTGLNVDARAALEQQFDDTPGGLPEGYSPPKLDDKHLEYLWRDANENSEADATAYIRKTRQKIEVYKKDWLISSFEEAVIGSAKIYFCGGAKRRKPASRTLQK